MSGDLTHGISLSNARSADRAGIPLPAGRSTATSGASSGIASSESVAGKTAAARATAKAIRDFQALFLMEMMKPLTQELAGASSEDAAESGFGLSTGSDVYSYFWGEALAQHLAGALPGLPGMEAIDGAADREAAAAPGMFALPGGAATRGAIPISGAAASPGHVAIPGTSANSGRSSSSSNAVTAGGAGLPDLASISGANSDPESAAIRNLRAALEAIRTAGRASSDATSVATSAPSAGRASGGSPLPEDVHALAGKAGRLFALPENLVRAVVSVESGGRSGAVSNKGAVGLMQLMPGTAKELGVKDPRNAWDNLVGGARYLARQLERFGSVDQALAAYNAGPGAVEKHGGVPPYTETRDYVRRVLTAKAKLDRTYPDGA